MEIELDFADWPMAMFGDDEFGDVGGDEIGFVLIVVVDTVKEGNKVGVLLDGTGFAEVGEDWARVIAAGDATGKLSEGDDGDFELAGEGF